MTLGLSSHFIDLEERDLDGNNGLMRFLQRAGLRINESGSMSRIVDLFLHLGANPIARNNYGDTCLHICIKYVTSKTCLETLISLIKGGADVYAINNSAVSVTALAYSTPYSGFSVLSRYCHYQNFSPTSKGPLWIQALESCDYNSERFRQADVDASGRIYEDSSAFKIIYDSDEELNVVTEDYASYFFEEHSDSNEVQISAVSQPEGSHLVQIFEAQTVSNAQRGVCALNQGTSAENSFELNDSQAMNGPQPIDPTPTQFYSSTAEQSGPQSNTFFLPWSTPPNPDILERIYVDDWTSPRSAEDSSRTESIYYSVGSSFVDQDWATESHGPADGVEDAPLIDLTQVWKVWDSDLIGEETREWADERLILPINEGSGRYLDSWSENGK